MLLSRIDINLFILANEPWFYSSFTMIPSHCWGWWGSTAASIGIVSLFGLSLLSHSFTTWHTTQKCEKLKERRWKYKWETERSLCCPDGQTCLLGARGSWWIWDSPRDFHDWKSSKDDADNLRRKWGLPPIRALVEMSRQSPQKPHPRKSSIAPLINKLAEGMPTLQLRFSYWCLDILTVTVCQCLDGI